MFLLTLLLICVSHTKILASSLRDQESTDATQLDTSQTELNGRTTRQNARIAPTVVCKNPHSISDDSFWKLIAYVENEHQEVIDVVKDATEKIDRAKKLLPIIECMMIAYKSNHTFIDELDAISEKDEYSFITSAKKRWYEMKNIVDLLSNEQAKTTYMKDKPKGDGSTQTNATDKTDIKERHHAKLEDFHLITQKTAIEMCKNKSIDMFSIPKIGIYVVNEVYDIIDAGNPTIKVHRQRQLQPIIDCLIYALTSAERDAISSKRKLVHAKLKRSSEGLKHFSDPIENTCITFSSNNLELYIEVS